MGQYLPFVVIGLTTGSVYALAGIGLVLTYKTSRIFNFAHGSMATVAVLLFFALVDRARIPWQLAALMAIAVVGPLIGLMFEPLARRLTPLRAEAKVLATLGLVLLLSGAISLWGLDAFGSHPPAVHPALPGSLVRILGVNVGWDQIIIMAVGTAMTLMLHLLIGYTSIGKSMRAVVENPELLAMTGRSQTTARRFAWALGIGFVTLSGLLLVLSPSDDVSFELLPMLVLQAFGAAAIGGFDSLPLTYFGGLLIGLASALSAKFITQANFLAGIPNSIPFLVLFLVLVVLPRHLAPERGGEQRTQVRRTIEVKRIWRLPIGSLTLAALLLIPIFKNAHLLVVSNEALAYAIIFLGLHLLVKTSGQVSLCQLSFAAVGAVVFVHGADSWGIPWFGAVLLGGVAAAAISVLVAIPAIRVAGVYLAVATFGFAALLEQLFYPTALMFGFGQDPAPRPDIGPFNANSDATYFVILLALFALALLLVQAVRQARLGRLLQALRDSPVGLLTQGTTINVTRVVVFCISAFLAGVGGALLVGQQGFLLPNSFGSADSLTVFVIAMTLRVAQPWGSLLAGAAIAVVPSYLGSGQGPTWWLDIGLGVCAILISAGESVAWLPRFRWAISVGPLLQASRDGSAEQSPWVSSKAMRAGLQVQDASIHYRGLVAVDHLDLTAPLGQITGLIGPNGAGKTTTFNYCSGLVQSVHGRILLHDRDISTLSPAARARRGLGRTFQLPNLFDSLTVQENINLGREGSMAGSRVLRHIAATPNQLRVAGQATAAAMELVGIGALAGREAGTLSTSEKRLVELARCLAGPFDVLLLDEPSSGLDVAEAWQFGEVLTRVVKERGIAILLVEHNMALVMRVCAEVYVLDFGHLVFAGSPSDAMTSEAVRGAYLGLESTT